MRKRRLAPLLAPLLLAGGCAGQFRPPGLAFSHVVEPLDTDFDATPVQSRTARGSVKHFEYSWARFLWDSNGIADVMRRRGLRRGEYADLQVLNVMGVWRQYTVRVYGPPDEGDGR